MGLELELTAATREPAVENGARPAHCRLEGVIDRRSGVDDVDYGIRFALALPERWNGRFLFQGGGGLNGTVNPPIGDDAAGDRPALARGFAVVSTDSGHQGAVFDASFFTDQEAALNFLYRAIGKVALTAEYLIDERYGRPADHSYFLGHPHGLLQPRNALGLSSARGRSRA